MSDLAFRGDIGAALAAEAGGASREIGLDVMSKKTIELVRPLEFAHSAIFDNFVDLLTRVAVGIGSSIEL